MHGKSTRNFRKGKSPSKTTRTVQVHLCFHSSFQLSQTPAAVQRRRRRRTEVGLQWQSQSQSHPSRAETRAIKQSTEPEEMSTENVDPSPEEEYQEEEEEEEEQFITEEQKARISLKFRAAKALLARKRPRPPSSTFPRPRRVPSESPPKTHALYPLSEEKEEDYSIIKRVPLSEQSANTPITIRACPDKKRHKIGYFAQQLGSVSPSSSGSIIKIDANNSIATTTVSELDSCRTSSKEQPQSINTLPDIFDDYFDDSILEQIDVLCQHKHSAQSESLSPDSVCGSGSGSSHSQRSGNQTTNVGDDALDSISKELVVVPSRLLKSSRNMPHQYAHYLDSLSERQQEAACCPISTPLMILAGPGSGKTSTMVGRILVMLNEGLHPSHILAMTFTTAAASEMRDRIGAIAGKEAAKELTVSTFHSFSLQLCRLHADKLGRTPEFSIFGQGQQRRAVIEAMRLLEKENSNYNADNTGDSITSANHLKDKSKKWQKFVTQAKASGKTPKCYIQLGNETGAAILEHYNDILTTCNALDYHDLISCSVKLLKDYPEVLKECQDTWKALIIDEFQDTSALQYSLLRTLACNDHITVVGDDDQSIFSFNGADISGFDSFRKDFPNHKEIRLNKNYRSTRYIVEAASSLIRNNVKRCQFTNVLTDNSSGSKVTIKECYNEDAQCSFVIDKILETMSNGPATNCTYGNVAILYRRQVSGKIFQTVFRARKIPFNIHGVAFYRKKVVRAIFAMLKTTLPGCDDGPYRKVFKALLPFAKEENKKVIDHIEKVSALRKCSFISAASDIFGAKISGTFKRSQLTQGRKVLSTLEMISKLVHREQSISTVITLVANMIPQKYLLEQRASISSDGGKLLNEDDDLRSVLQYLLDDVSNFLLTPSVAEGDRHNESEGKGCVNVLKAFVDFTSEKERENFRSRRHDNENSVTLTTMHQSKGLEWDTVFIVKTNESEIPLLHEFNGATKENGTSLEEERRLFYVAMTRARKQLFILYILMDSTWQLLQPSRFLKEIPSHLLDIQAESSKRCMQPQTPQISKGTAGMQSEKQCPQVEMIPEEVQGIPNDITAKDSAATMESYGGNSFLKRFSVDDRSVVSHLFHQWAKRPAFKDPKRLLDKVGFVIDERLRMKKNKHKDVLGALKSCLNSDDAFQYAEYVLRWEQLPADQRAHMMQEKQEHFQRLRIEKSMGSSAPTSKQISYLQNLGCTVTPTSRLHASRLIEQYKSL